MSRLGGAREAQFSRFHGNPDQFRAHVDALPAWPRDQDDPPDWVRPTAEVTGREPVEMDDHNAYSRKLLNPDVPPPLQSIPTEGIRSTQHQINLQAVRHYVDKPNELWDQDGWLGTNHPVIIEHPVHGHVVADGNSRFAAALIRGDTDIQAHVLPAARNPAHVEAVRQHGEDRSAATRAHGLRMDAVRQSFGTPAIGPKANPEAGAAFRRSYQTMKDEHQRLDRVLDDKLMR